MKQIFPKDIIEDSFEVHHAMHSKKSLAIYLIITIALLVGICSLFFIRVTIYNTSRGIIKSDREHMVLQSLQSGKIIFQNLKNNTYVNKGDTILIVSDVSLSTRENNTEKQIAELENFVRDLEILLYRKKGNLKTSKYLQEKLYYKEKYRELNVRYENAKIEYDRDKKLFIKNVIAKVDFDNSKLKYQIAESNKKQLYKQQIMTWQNQLVTLQEQIRDLKSVLSKIEEDRGFTVITAPISGYLLNVKGVGKGSLVEKGMQLATLSPESNLVIECYLSPSDIGLLENGNNAKFQIDAFNYNQWGLATGKIISIANDVQMQNNTPVFKVQCSLNQKALTLKNGFQGNLKKGMTLTARFELAQRTLFELLYDKIDDWVNPSTMK
ncbi:MAG: HlyD family efflux transporter periplasmic adaptor subunit [Tenacibaculum sp.]|nr:HlyD family efflux transporter periplasmic adaptor subunit [Tenacibaculum sp.]